MTEYIERAAAMDAILGLTIADPAVAQYADAVCYHLQNLPAADVAEVKHGRWVNHFDYMMERSGFFVCDSCKKMSREKYDYCPNCGARMGKEDEHEVG